jgi:hypothetical protein
VSATALPEQVVFGPMPVYGADAADDQRRAFVQLLDLVTHTGVCQWRIDCPDAIAIGSYGCMSVRLEAEAGAVWLDVREGANHGRYRLTGDEAVRMIGAIDRQLSTKN